MELSSKVEYALLSLIELASQPSLENPLSIGEIAARQSIPDRYLEQILNSLRRSRILKSMRGARGGYILARAPWQITLLEVIIAIEGDSKLQENKLSESSTLEKDTVYEIWRQATEETQALLNGYTLQDFCQKRDSYHQVNLMYYI